MVIRRRGGLGRRRGGLVKEAWWSRGSVLSCPCLWAARPGFESRPRASPQCGLRGGRSHCNTV